MSLRLSSFSEWGQPGSQIDYLEIRIGEQYAIPFEVTFTDLEPIDISTWSFSVTSQLFSATFTYNNDGELQTASTFTEQGARQSIAGLTVNVLDPVYGQCVLLIPANTTPSPQTLVTADGENTIVNIVEITTTIPTTYGIPNIRKQLLGLIVRFA